MEIQIRAPMVPPACLSPNRRKHWSVKSRAKKEYGEAVYFCAVSAKNELTQKVGNAAVEDFLGRKKRLDLEFIFPDVYSRDEDNLRAMFKSGQDALVKAGYFKDDKPEFIELGCLRITNEKGREAATIITLTAL